jgi:hypothetical protein
MKHLDHVFDPYLRPFWIALLKRSGLKPHRLPGDAKVIVRVEADAEKYKAAKTEFFGVRNGLVTLLRNCLKGFAELHSITLDGDDAEPVAGVPSLDAAEARQESPKAPISSPKATIPPVTHKQAKKPPQPPPRPPHKAAK